MRFWARPGGLLFRGAGELTAGGGVEESEQEAQSPLGPRQGEGVTVRRLAATWAQR